MIEIWKNIKGYEGIYELSNYGILHCLPRKYVNDRYTFGNKSDSGYMTVTLSYNKNKVFKRMHRLVWETFVGQIPEGYDVHHINGNKLDNRLENLELLSDYDHCIEHYKDKKEKINKAAAKKLSKSIVQYTLDGNFVAEYPSAKEAERQTGMFNSYINKCLRGKLNKAYGYVWKYKNN